MRSLPRGPVLSAVGEETEGKQAARSWVRRERVGRARGGGEGKAGPIRHQGAFSFFFLISNFFYVLFFQSLFQKDFEDRKKCKPKAIITK